MINKENKYTQMQLNLYNGLASQWSEENREPVVGSLDNLQPMIVPGLVIGLFVLVGIGLMIAAVRGALKKGGYFVGTPTRFLRYSNGTINAYDWEQFNGNIEVNFTKGDITFQLRTGNMVSKKNRPDQFVADSIENRRKGFDLLLNALLCFI